MTNSETDPELKISDGVTEVSPHPSSIKNHISKLAHKALVSEKDDFDFESIQDLPLIFIITSTYGNGDPPENAFEFLDFVQTEELDLQNLQFAVCALGDRSFTRFAQCGKDFEAALLKNNATQIFDRVDCDGDFEFQYEKLENLMAPLKMG